MVAPVSVAELNRVLPRRDRREHKDRITAFTERGGAAVPALKQVLRQLRMSRVAAATGGG